MAATITTETQFTAIAFNFNDGHPNRLIFAPVGGNTGSVRFPVPPNRLTGWQDDEDLAVLQAIYASETGFNVPIEISDAPFGITDLADAELAGTYNPLDPKSYGRWWASHRASFAAGRVVQFNELPGADHVRQLTGTVLASEINFGPDESADGFLDIDNPDVFFGRHRDIHDDFRIHNEHADHDLTLRHGGAEFLVLQPAEDCTLRISVYEDGAGRIRVLDPPLRRHEAFIDAEDTMDGLAYWKDGHHWLQLLPDPMVVEHSDAFESGTVSPLASDYGGDWSAVDAAEEIMWVGNFKVKMSGHYTFREILRLQPSSAGSIPVDHALDLYRLRAGQKLLEGSAPATGDLVGQGIGRNYVLQFAGDVEDGDIFAVAFRTPHSTTLSPAHQLVTRRDRESALLPSIVIETAGP